MLNPGFAPGKSSRQGLSTVRDATHVYWPVAVARAASRAIQAATTSQALGHDTYATRRVSAPGTTAVASVSQIVRSTPRHLIARSSSSADAVRAPASGAAPGPPPTNNSRDQSQALDTRRDQRHVRPRGRGQPRGVDAGWRSDAVEDERCTRGPRRRPVSVGGARTAAAGSKGRVSAKASGAPRVLDEPQGDCGDTGGSSNDSSSDGPRETGPRRAATGPEGPSGEGERSTVEGAMRGDISAGGDSTREAGGGGRGSRRMGPMGRIGARTAAAAGGGAGGGVEGSGPGRPRPLMERVRACRTLDQLVSLYGTAQREAEAQARWRAQQAGAAAAAAGLAGGAAAGLSASTVWLFLGTAWELVAAGRRRWQAGRRGAKGREATSTRAQLSSLLRDACGVVLWAERLAPGKACLLLSLLVAAGRYPGSEQHLGLLVEDSLNCLEAYSSSQVALAASSFARLRYFPGSGWAETMLEATSGQLSLWQPGELAFLLWALAKWRATPPAAWLQEYYAAFEACGERVSERDLSLVTWALGVAAAGRGGVKPPPSLTNHIMLEVQVRLPTLSGQALAHVAWGLCCCNVKPPGFWLREFHEASKATLPYATSGLAFSNLLWAFAAWQGERHPGEGWLEEACKQCARWLPSLDARSLAVLLLALSDLGHTPPVQWVGLALEGAHRNLPFTDPASAVAVLWAVSRFERQRAAAAAAAARPLPPRRRRLSSLSPEDVLLLADEAGLGFGGGFGGAADGSLGVNVGRGGAAGTPPHLRPARKWLVRYMPLIKDVAMAAAGVVPSVPPVMTHASPATAATGASGWSGGGSGCYTFEGLDANQMLDLVVALADLYVYPGDVWMTAHEARMASLAGGVAMSGPAARPPGSGVGSGLTSYQWQLLLGAYGALDDTWEGYAAPKAGEAY